MSVSLGSIAKPKKVLAVAELPKTRFGESRRRLPGAAASAAYQELGALVRDKRVNRSRACRHRQRGCASARTSR